MAGVTPDGDAAAVVTTSRGPVAESEIERVTGAVQRLMLRHRLTGTVPVRLTGSNCAGPMLVQANLTVAGTPMRVQTCVPGGGNIWPLVDRLDRRIQWARGPRLPRPWPDPTRRLLAGTAAGRVVRGKTVTPRVCDPAAAMLTLDAMDYDAHLFTDVDTGEDAVVFRGGPYGVRLSRQRRMDPPLSHPAALALHPHRIATLTDTDAATRVCEHGLPFLFYTHPADSRGRLLYRRYDGDLAVVSPGNRDSSRG